jgi:hypothetical protein
MALVIPNTLELAITRSGMRTSFASASRHARSNRPNCHWRHSFASAPAVIEGCVLTIATRSLPDRATRAM